MSEVITPAATVTEQRKQNLNNKMGLYFPHTIGHHAMILNFKDYDYGGGAHMREVSNDSIILPLPKNLQDNLNIKVGADELGITGSLAAESTSGAEDAASATSQIQNKIKGMFGDAKDEAASVSAIESFAGVLNKGLDTGLFLARAGLGGIAPDIAKGIGAGKGTAINPYATLVFSGVDLKVHTFEWLLSPDTPQEAETLRKIIRTIQRHVTPEMDGVLGESISKSTLGRGLLKYPSMVDCFFHGINNKFFYKLKTSMVSQFNVDYTPNGIALNKGGKPSAVRLNMIMTEAAIHTKADYQVDGAISTEELPEASTEGRATAGATTESVDATGGQLP
tara:strand:- start:795 stop:1802 length:1008 start_codon:yes stop_codon:yes gene_type:complete